MFPSAILGRRVLVRLLAAAATAALAQSARAGSGPPLANVPLAPPLYSIDLASPSIGSGIDADDILAKDGPLPGPGPFEEVPNLNLGLGRPGDELNGLSGSNRKVGPGVTFAILFGVDRSSVGGAPPDPGLVGLGFPYNMQQQAGLGQAAGDIFMATQLFDRAGPRSGLRVPNNNVLVVNQGDAGGVDLDLVTDDPPDTPTAGPIDNKDAMGYLDNGGLRGMPTRAYFSLDRLSPSLGFLPDFSAASIFLDQNLNAGGTETLYAQSTQLGLHPQDDVDAMIVFDLNFNGFFDFGDQVIFSLTPDSPSLINCGYSPADLITTNGLQCGELYAGAETLGLLATDNIVALELLLTGDIDASIHDHAIFPEPATCALLLVGLGLRRRRGR